MNLPSYFTACNELSNVFYVDNWEVDVKKLLQVGTQIYPTYNEITDQ